MDEARVPPGLVRTQISDQLAAATGDIEGNKFSTPPSNDLTDKASGDVTHVHHKGDPWVCAHPVEELGPWPSQYPEGTLLPHEPHGPHGRPVSRHAGGEWLAEENINVKGRRRHASMVVLLSATGHPDL